MTHDKKAKSIKLILRRLSYKIKVLPWINMTIILICCLISTFVFYQLNKNSFNSFDATTTLTNLLTVNGVFSAILITYLFSRVTWTKDRKQELFKEAISFSQKITEFRRILNKLTSYYDVWDSDRETKSLIDFNKFRHIDFYDYHLKFISNYKPHNDNLINELYHHPDFSEGKSDLYLAMVSLVRNRNRDYEYLEELHKDFEYKGLYNIKILEKWLNCGIFGSISYWLSQKQNWINYTALSNDSEYILSAAARINIKYKDSELNNSLIKELSDDFDSYYLKELYTLLKELKNGIQDLDLLIISLISISLASGVLLPFILLLIGSSHCWFLNIVAITASINLGIIAYFIFRFPYLINRELKWI